MTRAMPQEIEVWYLLPALRRELAKVFIKDHKLSQKEAAGLLGITEAAVSQYIKSKRGKEMKFSKQELAPIKEAARKILKDRKNVMKHIYDLCRDFRGSETICGMHRKHDDRIPEKCRICMGD